MEVPVLHDVPVPCALEEEPVLPAIPPPQSCLEGFLCWTLTDASQLLDNILTMQSHDKNNHIRCSP